MCNTLIWENMLESTCIIQEDYPLKNFTTWLTLDEQRHDKTNKLSVRPGKTQIRMPRLIWVFACPRWVAKGPSFLHADSEDSDQTGQKPRLIWVFAGRTTILLVQSYRGSLRCLETGLPSCGHCDCGRKFNLEMITTNFLVLNFVWKERLQTSKKI